MSVPNRQAKRNPATPVTFSRLRTKDTHPPVGRRDGRNANASKKTKESEMLTDNKLERWSRAGFVATDTELPAALADRVILKLGVH